MNLRDTGIKFCGSFKQLDKVHYKTAFLQKRQNFAIKRSTVGALMHLFGQVL